MYKKLFIMCLLPLCGIKVTVSAQQAGKLWGCLQEVQQTDSLEIWPQTIYRDYYTPNEKAVAVDSVQWDSLYMVSLPALDTLWLTISDSRMPLKPVCVHKSLLNSRFYLLHGQFRTNDTLCTHPLAYTRFVALSAWQTAALQPNEYASFTLLPNPATNYVNVTGFSQEPITAEVYDDCGRKILSSNISTQLDIRCLSAGLYIVRLSDSNGKQYVSKLFKIEQ